MASVNTTSVREKIARVEQEIAHLSDDGKVSYESRMLFNTLLMIVSMLVVIFMERSTKKTSKNSSIPPSQTTDDQSSTTPSSNKKGLAQYDESFDKSRTVETETVAPVMHVDETSMRVDKKNHWMHVCSAGDITLKRLHAKRGSIAMDEINTGVGPIIPRYGGIIIHDRKRYST